MEKRDGSGAAFEQFRKDINLPSNIVPEVSMTGEIRSLHIESPLSLESCPVTGVTIEDILRGHMYKAQVATRENAGINVNASLKVETPSGMLEYSSNTRQARSPLLDEPAAMTKIEGKILMTLMANSKIVHSASSIYAAVHGESAGKHFQTHSEVLKSHVANLRRKLGDTGKNGLPNMLIHTVRNNGYSLAGPLEITQEHISQPPMFVETPHGVLTYHPERNQVISPLVDEPVTVTADQGKILKVLMANPTIIHSASTLYAMACGEMGIIGDQAQVDFIRSRIRRIRIKLGDLLPGQSRENSALIHTVGNIGYSLTGPLEVIPEHPSQYPMSVETPHGVLIYHPERNQVISPLLDKPVTITAYEGAVLALLMRDPAMIHDSFGIYDHIHGDNERDHKTNAVKPHIFNLRKKLGDEGIGRNRRRMLIHTVGNNGYSLTPRYER